MWRVTAAYAAPDWIRHFDTRDDFAFLHVAPKMIGGRMRALQDVTGGNELGRTPAAGSTATVIGYPLGIGGSGIHCTSTIYREPPFSGFDCIGFRDGTSGGPWLAGRGNQRRVVGVVGGLHQGGCTAAQLYAAPLGDAAHRALFAPAIKVARITSRRRRATDAERPARLAHGESIAQVALRRLAVGGESESLDKSPRRRVGDVDLRLDCGDLRSRPQQNDERGDGAASEPVATARRRQAVPDLDHAAARRALGAAFAGDPSVVVDDHVRSPPL